MRSHRRVLVVVCLALATVVSAVSALNVAIPDIARDTGATQTQLSWIVDAYALSFAAFLLPAGALGDRLGRRRVLTTGLGLLAAALTDMFASGPGMLIALRAVLGMGAALASDARDDVDDHGDVPARAAAAWRGSLDRDRRASAVLGLLASGLLLEVWSWRSVFGLNVVLALLAIIGTHRVVPESAHTAAAARDAGGSVLSVAGLAAMVFSVIEAPTVGWTAARTLIGLVIGFLLLGAFLTWELRQRAPLLDPRLFRRYPFAASTLSIAVQFSAFFGFIFVFLQYLQLVRGDAPLLAAVSMLPLDAGLLPASRLAPRLAGRAGTAPLCTAGLLLIAGALLVLRTADAESSYWRSAGHRRPRQCSERDLPSPAHLAGHPAGHRRTGPGVAGRGFPDRRLGHRAADWRGCGKLPPTPLVADLIQKLQPPGTKPDCRLAKNPLSRGRTNLICRTGDAAPMMRSSSQLAGRR